MTGILEFTLERCGGGEMERWWTDDLQSETVFELLETDLTNFIAAWLLLYIMAPICVELYMCFPYAYHLGLKYAAVIG